MATPILNLVRPARAWSAGGTMIRLDGNDFRLRPPAARTSSGPIPAAPSSVEVLFDGVPSPHVEVVSSAILRVIVPPHAPDRMVDKKQITRGTVDVVVRNLDDDGNPIPGEEVTLPNAFSFTRPELGSKTVRGAWLRVVDGFLDHWRNIALENVVWNPSTDYDADTGDVRGYVKMATLPGIAVTRIAFPDSMLEPEGGPAEIDADDATILVRQIPVASDITFTLVLVSNTDGELVNLAEVVKACFRYAAVFPVQVDPTDPSHGVAEFAMVLTAPLQISERIGNTNLVTAEAPGIIFRVLTLDVPGTPAEGMPGVAKWIPGQGTKGIARHLEKLGIGYVVPKG